MYLKKYLEGVVITKEDVDEAVEYLSTEDGVFGRDDVFDRSKFDYIVDVHGGKLPIKIKAVKEGTVVPTKNVLLSIENTDPNCFWLTNFIENSLLQICYPITVCTLSLEVKKLVDKYFDLTTDFDKQTSDFVKEFVLNDFGVRGVSSIESAEIGGAAHLVNFMGSDNLPAARAVRNYYNTRKVYAKSVPATEHSIMTMLGEEGELEMMKRTLETFPTGIVACVSDSFNNFRACSEYWGGELKELILSRPATPGNQLVIRPDSGDPIKTLEAVFEILFDKFGYTVNSKGFKVLPPQIRVIQGDGVNLGSIEDIYKKLYELGISAENIVFGMGGKLLQADVNRDTNNFAIKCSFAVVNGQEVDVVKNPTEMDADGNIGRSFKKSKKGLLKLIKTESGYQTVGVNELGDDLLLDVFENGKIINEFTFEEIREMAK
jgi:nicotinamide phosphoribosyltransferase